jgi:tetratricopeptide (TPR) repeat protein
MPPDLPKTALKFFIALLKNQAKLWLGEDAAGIVAQTLIDEDLQKRLDDWLKSDRTARELLKAAEQAQVYLQDPRNCTDEDLRRLFRDMAFGDLPSVQAELAELPQAMDTAAVTDALRQAFERDVPNLSHQQCENGARLYTDALLRAVGSLEDFTLPIIRQVVLDNSKKLDTLGVGQAEIKRLLEKLIARENTPPSPSPILPGDLPPGSYLPFPRNAFFTGRTEDLEKLKDVLISDHQSNVVINQAITGMGGIGKTQLAVEFAYAYGYLFCGVHWLDLRDPESLETQIALCGEKMGLAVWPPTLPEQVTATMREWLQNDPRLLILDNFEDIEYANEALARLRHSCLRLLITSRRSDWSSALGLRRLPLDEFLPQESRDFLRKYLPEGRETDANLGALAKHLGHLPLALELAGRYLERQSRLKITTYLAQLDRALEHKSMQNRKAEQKSLTGHDLSLLQTFAQSWEQVKDPKTRRLFVASGYCAPNTPIPAQLLEAALDEQEAEVCDECLSDLMAFGLFKEGPSVHPLLAQFARRLDADHSLLSQFSEALSKLANRTNHEEDHTGNYSLYTPILPHVRDVAGYAEIADLAPAGQLWNSLGYHISDLADYAGAKAAYERALKIDEATYGPDHPTVAIRVNNLGGVLQALGDLAGAKAAYERALKIFIKFLPTGHPNIKTVQGNLDNL